MGDNSKAQNKTNLQTAYSEFIASEQEQLIKKKAQQLGLTYVDLRNYPISPQVLEIIPKEVAEKYQVVAYLKAGDTLKVAAVDPTNQEMQRKVREIAREFGLNLHWGICSEASWQSALRYYPKRAKEISREFEIKTVEPTAFAQKIQSLAELKQKIKQIPTTQLLETILSGAVISEASDIHLEPKKETLRIRYRIDGVLNDVAELAKEAHKALLSRIKFLAKMRMDISTIPQDGRFTFTAEGKIFDIRTSVFPTIYGETVVMRLLEHEAKFKSLEELGFHPEIREAILESIKKPTGLILNTGPTGSGKTTTLYAILDKLNQPGVKIITIEDPVEYKIPGIVQTQVDPKKGFDFANALKYTLRQDPDIILVGEIRDVETAHTALTASLTGHLVLSTLHTNNAPSALNRLIDMGVKPYLLPGAIRLIIAQRLVRKICQNCKEEYEPDDKLWSRIEPIISKLKKAFPQKFEKVPKKLWRGRGCEKCNGTGYKGRTPIAEFLKPSPKIEKMVTEKATITETYQQARKEGMISMEEDGIRKTLEGITTPQEVWRVTAE